MDVNANPELLWNNEFDFELDILNLAKSARNEAGIGLNDRFSISVWDLLPPEKRVPEYEGHQIHLVGTPKMSDIKSMMVGVRNPDDAGGAICAEVWFNELRATDFRQEGGHAATAQLNFQWGDFANINASGSIRTPNFGGLETTLNERSRELTRQYDLNGTFALGKFFPKNWGVDAPFYATYGERFVDPQFNPLESDVLTEDYINLFPLEQRDSIRKTLRTYQRNRGLSLNNFRIVPNGKDRKNWPWSIRNFNTTFAWNQQEFQNHLVESRVSTTHRASIGYSYAFKPKLVRLFKNPKHHNPLTEFNFYLGPKSISFQAQGNRQFEYNRIRKLREGPEIDPTYFRNFTLSRNFNINWDLTKNISANFSSSTNGRVDEPLGNIPSEQRGDSLLGNLFHRGQPVLTPVNLRDSLGLFLPGKDKRFSIGRNTAYNHSFNVNYVLPFSSYPWLDWINGTVSYQSTLNWQVAPDNNLPLGNVIGNTQTINGTAQVNLGGLYRKVPFLRKVMTGEAAKPKKDSTEQGDSFHFLKLVGREFMNTLLSVQNVSGTYTRNMGTVIPGYEPGVDLLGIDRNFINDDSLVSPITPPTVPFLLGWQYPLNPSSRTPYSQTLRGQLENWSDRGWISRDKMLANRVTQNMTESITARTSLTLFRDLRIDLNVARNKGYNYSEIFRFDGSDYRHENQLETGSFNMTTVLLPSAFSRLNEANDWTPQAFRDFGQNRSVISERLSEVRVDSAGTPVTEFNQRFSQVVEVDGLTYQNGYNRDHQDVLIPAFLSAYGYASPDRVKLDPFSMLPLPNWNMTYNGLNKLPLFKDVFKSFTLKHAYRGNFAINGYTSDVQGVSLDTIGFSNFEQAYRDDGKAVR